MDDDSERTRVSPARVLLVEINEDGTVGGSHQCLYDLARRLDRTSFEPIVVFYEDNRFVRLLRDEGVPVHVWDAERRVERRRRFHGSLLGKVNTVWKTIGAVVRRLRLLRREHIDLVHLNNSPCIGFDDWLPAARLAGVPISSHARGPYVAPASAPAKWLTRRFDAIIAISDHIAANFVRAGIPRSRVRRIYDGIDIERLEPRPPNERRIVRDEQGVSDEALVVILVGLIRFWKGQDVAVAALRGLPPDERSRVRLWLVGEAPASDAEFGSRLHRAVEEAGLGETVQFLGFRQDVARLMGAADVVLHASTLPEPFGLVVVEGLALGKTVVASKLGGPAEIVREGEGILFDPTRPDELASILSDIIRDPSAASRFAAAAQRRARDFDVRRNVDAVTGVWDELRGRFGSGKS